jgi:hypothetical protein
MLTSASHRFDAAHAASLQVALESSSSARNNLGTQQGSNSFVDVVKRDMHANIADFSALKSAAANNDGVPDDLPQPRASGLTTVLQSNHNSLGDALVTPKESKDSLNLFYTPTPARRHGNEDLVHPLPAAEYSLASATVPTTSSQTNMSAQLSAATDRYILTLLHDISVASEDAARDPVACHSLRDALSSAFLFRRSLLTQPLAAVMQPADSGTQVHIVPSIHEATTPQTTVSPALPASQTLSDLAAGSNSPTVTDIRRRTALAKSQPVPAPDSTFSSAMPHLSGFQRSGNQDTAAGVLATVLADTTLDLRQIPVLTSVAPLDLGKYYLACQHWLLINGSNHIRTLHSYSVKGIAVLTSLHVELRDKLCGASALTLTDIEFLAVLRPLCSWHSFWTNMLGFPKLELEPDCLNGWASLAAWSTELDRRLEITNELPSPTELRKFVLKNGLSPFVQHTLETHFATSIGKWTLSDLRLHLAAYVKDNDRSIRCGYTAPAQPAPVSTFQSSARATLSAASLIAATPSRMTQTSVSSIRAFLETTAQHLRDRRLATSRRHSGTATTHGLVRATGLRRPAPVASKMMFTPTTRTTLLLSPTPARTHRRLQTGLSPSTLHHPVVTGTISPPSLYAHRILPAFPVLFNSPAAPSLTPLSSPSPTVFQTRHQTQTLLLLFHPATVCNSTSSLTSRLPTTPSTLVPFNRTSSTPTTSSSTALA